MTLASLILAVLLVTAVVLGLRARRAGRPARPARPVREVAARVYSRRGFLKLGGAVAGAAVLVYSGADEAVDDWIHEGQREDASEPVSFQVKQFGEPYWAFGWVALALVDRFVGPSAVGRFGRECMQATALGLPILWTTQRVLGAGRPTDEPGVPDYRPFHDENAASGHTFIAAVPWLVLVRRSRAPWAKALAGAMSPLTGLSRMHDRKHYLSQVWLGWAIAWQAVDGVVGGDETSH